MLNFKFNFQTSTILSNCYKEYPAGFNKAILFLMLNVLFYLNTLFSFLLLHSLHFLFYLRVCLLFLCQFFLRLRHLLNSKLLVYSRSDLVFFQLLDKFIVISQRYQACCLILVSCKFLAFSFLVEGKKWISIYSFYKRLRLFLV